MAATTASYLWSVEETPLCLTTTCASKMQQSHTEIVTACILDMNIQVFVTESDQNWNKAHDQDTKVHLNAVMEIQHFTGNESKQKYEVQTSKSSCINNDISD